MGPSTMMGPRSTVSRSEYSQCRMDTALLKINIPRGETNLWHVSITYVFKSESKTKGAPNTTLGQSLVSELVKPDPNLTKSIRTRN